jgi:branched-chain amino acid transport system permease protein
MVDALTEQVIHGLMMGSIYVLVALGMVLIYGVMHVVNFAHGVLFTLGGYFGHFFYTHLIDSYLLATLLSMLSLGLIGVMLERGVFRPLNGNLRNQVIASLGLILALENLVVALWGPNALQWRIAAFDRQIQFGELRLSVHHLGIIAVTFVLVTALGLYLKFTRFGTAIRATSQSQEAARVVGIPVQRVQWTTFAIGCMLAAVGGALVGPLFLVFPQMGDVQLSLGSWRV